MAHIPHLITLLFMVVSVWANTEALFFLPKLQALPTVPTTPIEAEVKLQLNKPLFHDLHFNRKAPNCEGLAFYSLFPISKYHGNSGVNAKISWSALDPTDFSIDLLKSEDSSVFLEVKGCYFGETKEREIAVPVALMVDELVLGIIPGSLVGVIGVILGSALTGLIASRWVYNWLVSL